MLKKITQYSFLQFFKIIFQRLGFMCFKRSLIFLHLDLNNLTNDLEQPYSFFMPVTADIEKSKCYYGNLFSLQTAVHRLQCGHLLFVLKDKDKDKFIYYLWAEKNDATIYWFDLRFKIPQNMLYITGIYTEPLFRNKGIGTKLKKEILHYLKGKGYRHVIEVVNPFNVAALSIDKKLGFKKYQIVTYKRYWHIKYFKVQKFDSENLKKLVALFKTPQDLWKTFLNYNG